MAAPGASHAQLDALRVGTRARLRAPGVLAAEAEGVVIERRADTLWIALRAGGLVPVPMAAITSARVYHGRSARAGARAGARRGAYAGLGLGVFNAGFSDCGGAHCGVGDHVLGIGVFTVLGAGTGAALGAAIRAERWERLAIASGPQPNRPAPSPP